jgi:hypothetical protein
VPPKPVIGKVFDTWGCFHECPKGKARVPKNGWPELKPPRRQPMFPDREFKRGEFIN